MSSHSATFGAARAHWDDDLVTAHGSRAGRVRGRRARITGVLLLVGMMGGIVVNATLLQTAHVAAIVVADETEQSDARPALVPASVQPAPSPIVAAPQVAEAELPAVDMTPTGSIPPSAAASAAPPIRAPISRKPKPRSSSVKAAAVRQPDAIAALLRRLGSIR